MHDALCSVDSYCVYQVAVEEPAAAKPPKPTALAADYYLCYPAADIELAAAAPTPPKLAPAYGRPTELLAEGGPPKLAPPKAEAGPPKDAADLG